MKKFTEVFAPAQIVPNGKGVNPEVLSALNNRHPVREPFHYRTQRGLAKAGDPAKPPTGTFSGCHGRFPPRHGRSNAVLTCLANAYAVAKPDEAEAIKAMTCDFCRQLLELKAGANDMRTIFVWGLAMKGGPNWMASLAD